MFTLKFTNAREGFTKVVSAESYELRQKHDPAQESGKVSKQIGVTVIVYPKTSAIGYEMHVGDYGRDHYYDSAFIENQAGKTIDRVGPFAQP